MRKAELAWNGGDQPESPDFLVPVEPALAAKIMAAVGPLLPQQPDENASVSALRPNQEPAGRYRLQTEKADWFVRISGRHGLPDTEKSVTEYLNMMGSRVPRPIAVGVPFQWRRQHFRLDIRPHIKARHFNDSAEDVLSLAETLANCHAILRDCPVKEEIQEQAARRYGRIDAARKKLIQACQEKEFSFLGESANRWAREHRNWIAGWVNDLSVDFHLRQDAQPLHGEIHPGNVLYTLPQGNAVLIDFEECPFTFAPPEWDAAYLIQRFLPTPDRENLIIAGKVCQQLATTLPRAASMMGDAARTLVCIAAMIALEDGIETPVPEFEKFKRLEQQVAAWRALA